MHVDVRHQMFEHLCPKFFEMWLHRLLHIVQSAASLLERVAEGVDQREPPFLRQLDAVLLALYLACRLTSSGN